MNLFLFTNTFPFKQAESFLINEFEFTKKYFKTISILSFYGEVKDACITPDAQVKYYSPLLSSPAEKNKVFRKGLFNFSPLSFHLQDFFRQKVFLSSQKTYWFVISLLITRFCMASKSYKALLKDINEAPEPVLYFYWADGLCWILPYLQRKLKKKRFKIIIRLHRADLYENLKGDYAPLRHRVFSLADLLVPISEDGRLYLQDKYPAIKNKLMLSRLGVFDQGLNPPNTSNTKCVVSVSSLTEVKRVHLIFEALQKTRTKIVWHHYGSGPLEGFIKNLVTQKRAGLEVVFHGYVDNTVLMQFYQSQGVDFLINVSSSEGLPVSIMEALSFGVPVMATNAGGTAELVNDGVGKLIDVEFTTDFLAGEMEKLLHLDSEKIKVLRQNSRKAFEDNVNAAVNYPEFYNFIIEKLPVNPLP